MKRLAISAAFALVAVTGLSTSASAATPIHLTPGVEEFEFVIGGVCDFDVLAHVRQRLRTTFFLDGGGNVVRGITRGSLVVWLTNLDSGKTIRRVIPGPGFSDASGVIVRGAGPWAFIFTLEGEVINAWGHITFENGLVVGVRGRTEPFCGALV